MDRSSKSSSPLSSAAGCEHGIDHDIPRAGDAPEKTPQYFEKSSEIVGACQRKDFKKLIELATSRGGFLEDKLRRIAWPVLLGFDDISSESHPSWSSRPRHRDEDQVKLDVNRSFIYYPNHQSQKQLDHKKQELSNVINQVLRTYPQLCYFQGYHDIVQVMLLVLGYDLAVPAVTRLSILRIRDFMLPTLTAAVAHLRLLPAILYQADRPLCAHIQSTLTQPFFALASTLTLYAHDIQGYGDIARLFDFLLAREPVISVYLFAEIILARKKELLEIAPDEPEMLHFTLSKLPVPFNLEQYISNTITLYEKYPPSTLPFRVWGDVSQYSVLKTGQDVEHISRQKLEFGLRMFEGHATQVRRIEALQKLTRNMKRVAWIYRRQVGAAGLAVVVGIIALWLGRRQPSFSPLQRMVDYSLGYFKTSAL